MIKYVFFDLDGTLLPMDQEKFLSIYFKHLGMAFAKKGYDPQLFLKNLYNAVVEIIKNNTDKYNDEVFWGYLENTYGSEVSDCKELTDEFYKNEFFFAKEACGVDPEAVEIVKILKDMGIKLVLATNPAFPLVATATRLQWGGVMPDNFEFITTYDNSKRCKPNLEYYLWLADKMGVKPSECLMVGNDVRDDMSARFAGLNVYLVPRNLLNPYGEDTSVFRQGSLLGVADYVNELNAQ